MRNRTASRILVLIVILAFIGPMLLSAQEQKVKPGTIGFSLPFATAPFYWAAANGLKEKMGRMGYRVVVTNAANDPNRQFQQLENFRTQKVQGVAIIAYDFAS